jgi:hypothetical protein
MSVWPQYTIAGWLFAQLFWHLINDMKVPARTSDRVTSVLASFIVFGLVTSILWAGGFWAPVTG